MIEPDNKDELKEVEIVKDVDNAQAFRDKAYSDYKEYKKNLWKIPINIWQQLQKPQRIV